MAWCLRQPAELSEKLRAEGYVPIQQRIGDLQRAKLEGLERIRREVDEENRDVLTFQPKVNKRTHKIIERARQAGDDPSTGQEQIASGADQNVGSRLNSYAERQVCRVFVKRWPVFLHFLHCVLG